MTFSRSNDQRPTVHDFSTKRNAKNLNPLSKIYVRYVLHFVRALLTDGIETRAENVLESRKCQNKENQDVK